MRKKIAAAALVGALGLTGAAVLGPAVASAQSADPGSSRLSAFQSVLQGLVTDGTLTSAQADKVASRLDETMPMRGGRGMHGGAGMGMGMGVRGGMLGHDVVAEALGLTAEQLHEARQDGKTLAEIAKEKGISRAELIATLVDAAKDRLAESVADERITQAQADTRLERIEQRIGDMVDQARGMGFGGRGHGGPHHLLGPVDPPRGSSD